MRYNFYSNISISYYLVVVLLYKCLQCQDVCQQPKLLQYEKVIYVNDSFLYSHRYNYTMRITLNQPNPVKNRNFEKTSDLQEVKPNFQFKYYESQVDSFDILLTEDLFAVRLSIKKKDISKQVTATIFCLIYPSGKISIYYEDISTEINPNRLALFLRVIFWCKTDELASDVIVPVKWIKSGTLVEYEPMGESCAKYNTSESCENARPSDIACIWCDKNNTCIDIYYQNTDYLKENNCRVKRPDVNDSTTQTSIKYIQTTSATTEVQHTTAGIT
ncbi:unnamed protein product, partial [Schistosoma rodhaini]